MSDFLTSEAPTIVRGLAFSSLFGLLFAFGLETPLEALWAALRKVRLSAMILGNFVLIPVLAVFFILKFSLGQEPSRALLLLACAPFAPVVPLFVRMAHGHLALATGLTAVFPAFSALLTPAATALSFWLIQDQGHESPSPLLILEVLAASITLPLCLGTGLRATTPELAIRIRKPVEWLSEAVGVLSLGFLATLESSQLGAMNLQELWPFMLFYEITFLIGLALGERGMRDRLVVAFGSANRNIGLAILLASTLTDDTKLLGQVFVQSLLMLAFGLLHVGAARILLGPAPIRR